MATAPDRIDVFPASRPGTWFDERLDHGPEGRAEVNRYVMSVYAHPLKVYFRGSSFRNLGDPDEIIAGFFASRLDRDDFLASWRASGKRLRRWLMNALLFYLREVVARERKWKHAQQPIPEHADDGGIERADRAWAAAVVRAACERVAETCAESGQHLHWDLFFLHRMQGRSYVDLGMEFGLAPKQVYVKVRTVQEKIKREVREGFIRDGVPEDEVDREIERTLEAIP